MGLVLSDQRHAPALCERMLFMKKVILECLLLDGIIVALFILLIATSRRVCVWVGRGWMWCVCVCVCGWVGGGCGVCVGVWVGGGVDVCVCVCVDGEEGGRRFLCV